MKLRMIILSVDGKIVLSKEFTIQRLKGYKIVDGQRVPIWETVPVADEGIEVQKRDPND